MIRSIIFNALFYLYSAIYCLLVLPFVIFPRSVAVSIVRAYLYGVYLLEKFIIGLDFEIRGEEYLPKEGPYLVAAKHQSAYETMKLYRLFGDPAIILKKELTRIPIWGWYLGRIDAIGIDRSTKDQAMKTLLEGAHRIKEQGRPIVIFPQGTRTDVKASTRQKPYKGGIARIYEATSLPIIPMALNSGLYWPRNDLIRRPGKVVFQFLPPIEAGLPEKKVMKALEERIETASIALMEEAKEKNMLLKNIETVTIEE